MVDVAAAGSLDVLRVQVRGLGSGVRHPGEAEGADLGLPRAQGLEQGCGFGQVAGSDPGLELGPLGIEARARAGGQQLDGDLLDRPDDGQFDIGGQDLIQPRALRYGQVGLLAGQQGAVLPGRVGDPPAAGVQVPRSAPAGVMLLWVVKPR